MKKEFFELSGFSKASFSALSQARKRRARSYFALYEVAKEQNDKAAEEYYISHLKALSFCPILEEIYD